MAVEERAFASDVALMLATRVLVLASGVGASVVIARTLGAEGRGAIAVVFALTLLLVQLGTLGLPSANTYFTATHPADRPAVVANAVWATVGLSVVLALVALAIRALAPSVLQGVDDAAFALALAGLPAILGYQLLQGVLLGEGRTVAYNVVDAAAAVATFAGICVALIALDGAETAAVAVLVGGRVVALAAVALVLRGDLFARPRPALLRRMLVYALRIHVAAVLAYLVIRLDLLLVNGYLGPEQAGFYAVAIALADALNVIPAVIATNLFARVSRGLGDDATASVFRFVALVYGAVCVLAALVAAPLISLLYGGAFAPAAELFWALAPGLLCLGLLNVLAQHFAGRGFPLEAMLVWFAGLALNLAINLLWLERGTIVASIASSAAYALLLVLHMRMFARDGGYGRLRPRLGEAVGIMRVALRRG